jgi:transcription antitermination factor NusG
MAIMPSFAFANYRHAADLIELKRRDLQQVPDFSVMILRDVPAMVRDRELDPLRVAERMNQPLDKVKTYSAGDRVKMARGSFEGMGGIVERTKGKFTLVSFPGFSIAVQIPTLQLLEDSAMGMAA